MALLGWRLFGGLLAPHLTLNNEYFFIYFIFYLKPEWLIVGLFIGGLGAEPPTSSKSGIIETNAG